MKKVVYPILIEYKEYMHVLVIKLMAYPWNQYPIYGTEHGGTSICFYNKLSR